MGNKYGMLMLIGSGLVAFLFSLGPLSHVFAAEEYAGEVLKVDVAVKKLTVKKPDGNRFTSVSSAVSSGRCSTPALPRLHLCRPLDHQGRMGSRYAGPRAVRPRDTDRLHR